MKVLIADKFEESGLEALRQLGCDTRADASLSAEAIPDALAQFDPQVLVVRSTKVTAAAIERARSLRLIVRAGSGYDNIDCKAASARGIAVSNCPGMNAVAVAELTMGLLLCCDRRLPDQTAELRAGNWRKKEFSRARGLKGSTLGVVGVGMIGRELIRRARAFDMQVIAWSRSMTPRRAAEMGVECGGSSRGDLLRMVATCDAVSVHVALNDDTKGLCDDAFFKAMKPGSYFINTSRGGIVDAAALAGVVRDKGICCGLDVFGVQPAAPEAPFADPIIGLPGVYGTHHCGASTDQAQLAVAEEVVRVIRVYKESGKFENRVNGDELKPTVRSVAPSERIIS